MIALPAWLVTNAIVVAGLYPIAWLLSRLCRTRPAAAHLVWLVLMAKLVAPPLVYWPWSLRQLADALTPAKPISQPVTINDTLAPSAENQRTPVDLQVRDPQISIEQSSSSASPAYFDPPPVAEAHWNLASATFLLWSLGAGATALGGLRALWLQRRALGACQPAPDCLVRRIKELASQIGIRPPVALIRERLSTPVLCCAGRPRLLWPSAMSDSESVAHSDGVLAHELAHIKRHDHGPCIRSCWSQLSAGGTHCQLHETRELACDALALAVARQPRADYARELLAISTARRETIVLAAAFGAGLASRHFLKRRLTMVFDEPVSGRTPASSVALLLALAAAALPAVTLADQAVVSTAPAVAQAAVVEEQPAVAQSDASVSPPPAEIPRNAEPSNMPARKLGKSVSGVFRARLPNGGGILRVSKNDDGSIAVDIEPEAGQLEESQVKQRSDIVPTPGQSTKRVTSSSVSGTTLPALAGVNTTAASQALPSPATAPQPTLSGAVRGQAYPTPASSSLSARDALETEMQQSDVDLAKINLQEKEVQLEIAQKDGSDANRLRLAKLAVDRAMVELKRAELQLKRGISARGY